MAQIGSVEPDLPFGGDFTFLPGGEMLLISDVPGNYAATYQRIVRVIQGISVVQDNYGNYIGAPDDLFNPKFGSSLLAYIGENFTPNVELQITTNILNSLQGDPGLNPNAVPTVAITPANGDGQFYVTVTATLSNGALVTFPSVLVSVS